MGASIGSVKLIGPAGIARSDTVTWAPPGYNPAYGTFELLAVGNALNVTLTPNQGLVRNPIFVIDNFTAASVQIRYDGNLAVADLDYFASLDAVNNRLWLTVRRDLQVPLALMISDGDVIFTDGFQ